MLQENPELAVSAKAFVDGVDVSRRCYGADEELGEAYCYVENDKGMIAQSHSPNCRGLNCTLGKDEPNGCHMLREVLRGEVRIEVSDKAMACYLNKMQKETRTNG